MKTSSAHIDGEGSVIYAVAVTITYISLVAAYCFYYAPVGLENNDGGFLLALAYEWHKGYELYDHIVYIRPPVSIFLHSFYFLYPFNLAPVLISRYFCYFEIGVYSVLAAILFGKWFNLSVNSVFFIACLSFINNAHNFPAMAWHTIDGILFSVIALYLVQINPFSTEYSVDRHQEKRPVRVVLKVIIDLMAMVSSIFAALCKQPFFVVPVLVFFYKIYPFKLRSFLLGVLISGASIFIVYIFLSRLVSLHEMLFAITSTTELGDLLSAGLMDYFRDWMRYRSVICVGPMGLTLVAITVTHFSEYAKKTISRYLPFLFLGSLLIFSASLLELYLKSKGWISPQSLFDTLFTISLLISILFFFKTLDRGWLGITFLHIISWAASISWGYKTVILFSSPIIGVVVMLVGQLYQSSYFKSLLGIGLIIFYLFTYALGSAYLYSLEGPVRRSDAKTYVGEQFNVLRGIYTTYEQALALNELKQLTTILDGTIVVGPNWPLYNLIFGRDNPIGAPWLLNAEVGPYEGIIRSRIKGVKYFFLFKNANPSPFQGGRYGSSLTCEVVSAWLPVKLNTRFFEVYLNPAFVN
ncbi:MAG: hypothetical protein RMJ39_10380 [Deltaproteobacteria bacterium]|nr:hypothetical protein [Deltaproteobacteria bacterium]